MTKSVRRLGVTGVVVGLLIAGAASASAQGLLSARQNVTTETVLDFKGICFRSLLGINDEVLADSERFPCTQDGLPGIELSERFGDFTNATVTARKDRNTGKLVLSDVKFVKALGTSTDDKALLKEYEHAVDLVSKLLGVSVTCPGLVDPAAYLGRRYLIPIDRRIKLRTLLNLAKGQRVEIEATEASYAIRAGQPIQTMAPIVEIKFAYSGSFGARRSSGQDSESVKELTLGTDCSDLLSVKMRIQQEQSKLRELERARQRQQLASIQEELKRVCEAKAAVAKSECVKSCSISKSSSEKISVAEKLGQCDFLLNKDFKKNAKVYLCLFSASWCPPCRAEMPRIAKTYAETLKDDPDIELIHFSRDQDDEKAMAWAKEHDVKFPVVKPKGGNPLDLHSRGIPHLFIVKADGTLLEEGHPMKVFTEEKLREFGLGSVNGNVDYAIVGGDVFLADSAAQQDKLVTLDIPGTITGIPVRGIGDRAFYCCKRLKSVSIPSGVTNIGDSAFWGCSGLTSLTIPQSVTRIGGMAFGGCGRIETVTIPPNVEYIGTGAFIDSGLRSLKISEGVTCLNFRAFYGCPKLASVIIPSSVTSIEWGAFSGCEALTSVTIPSNVSDIGDNAFAGCGLASIKISNGVTIIGFRAFYQCSKLTSVTIPSSVARIGGQAFEGCIELNSVTMSGERPDSHDNVFGNCAKLKAIHVPANAKSWTGMKEWQGIPLVFDAE